MSLYMTQFGYTSEAWAALVRNPEDRGAAISGLMESMGSRMVAYYHSFGEYDGVVIFESPDEITAAAGVLAAITPGHIKTIKTTPLLTVEDTMEAMRKAGEMTYLAPSG